MLLRLFRAQKSWTEKTFLSLTSELIVWLLENAPIHILILKLQGYIFLWWQLPQFYCHPRKKILFSKYTLFIFWLRIFVSYISLCTVKCWWLASLVTDPTSSTLLEAQAWKLRSRIHCIPSSWTQLLLCSCIKLLQYIVYFKYSWNKYLKLLCCLLLVWIVAALGNFIQEKNKYVL